MKTSARWTSLSVATCWMVLRAWTATAQTSLPEPVLTPPPDSLARVVTSRALEPQPVFVERDLSGPRVGFTIAAGDGETETSLRRRGIGRMISQFGWHFEHQIRPLGGGPQLVTEMIPLFGGVEYGRIIPSLTFALGLRTAEGFEFGMGPSFTATTGTSPSMVGLVLAAGKTIDYGGVCVPMNLAVSVNPNGSRITLAAGYAIHQASRVVPRTL
jgi:hypothetical protein